MEIASTLPIEEVTAVGRVVVNFQHLERTIVRLIWIMAAADENIGQQITARLPFSKILDLLSSVFHYRVEASTMLVRFDNLMSTARQVNEGRNRIVHSWWFTDLDGGAPSRLKFTSKGAQDTENIDKDALSVTIVQLADDFAKLIDELYDAKLIRKKPGISLDSL
jgi:hypothetical protein